MAAQIATASVLLVAAALLGRSFVGLLTADRGFDPAGILAARVSMPTALYESPERRFTLVEQVLDRLAEAPDVTSAAFTSELPLTPGGSSSAFTLPSRTPDGAVIHVQASPRIVSPRYFATVGMRIIAGRSFSPDETESAPLGVVVNQAFARRYLGDAPLGTIMPMAGYGAAGAAPRQSTIIGVVDDVRYVTASEVTQPELFYSYRQLGRRLPVQTITMLVRTSGDPRRTADVLRAAVRAADERLVADAVAPLEQRLLTTLARPRLYAVLLGGLAAAALIIATVGLFGSLSYSVSLRSSELALRGALGATRADILRLVLRQGLTPALAGLAAGMLASIWLMRLLSSQLYGVTPHDMLTFTLVPLSILFCAGLACVAPARRAARLDPLRLLRDR